MILGEGEAPNEDLLEQGWSAVEDADLESTMLFDRLPSAFYQRPGRRVRPRDE